MQTQSDLVNSLISAVVNHQISVTQLPADEFLNGFALKEVEMNISDHVFRCLGDNEYGDLDKNNAPLILNMVLMELENYEQSDDFLGWARDCNLPTDHQATHDLWTRLQQNSLGIHKLLGTDICSLSSWDWQLNAGDAQILRELPSRFSRPDISAG